MRVHKHCLDTSRLGPAVVLVVMVAFVIAACGGFDAQPTVPSQIPFPSSQEIQRGESGGSFSSGFYPLEVGNEWTYRGQWTSRFEGDSLIAVMLLGERRQLIGTEEILGRRYMVERRLSWNRLLPFPPGDTAEHRVYYRQDRAGLYESDWSRSGAVNVRRAEGLRSHGRVEASISPDKREAYAILADRVDRKMQIVNAAIRTGARGAPGRMGPPGGAQSGELTRLKYPLHPGQEWVLRDDLPFEFSSYVESHDVFDLPAGRMNGYRIRIESSVFGPKDRLEVWYGRDGFLGLSAHFETSSTSYQDPYGQDSLVEITEQYMTLESLRLVPHGHSGSMRESP